MQYPPVPGEPGPPPPPTFGYGYGPASAPGYGQGYPGGPQPPWMPNPAPDSYTQLPPTPPASGARRGVSAIAIFVLLAGVLATAFSAFLFLRAGAESVGKMVPNDTVGYMTYYLDPPGGQKLALSHLMDKFPALGDSAKREKAINGSLDTVLKSLGMDHTDVTPWLGGQVSFSLGGDLAPAAGKVPSFAAYIATKSDSATTATVGKLRTSLFGAALSYTDQSHDGVTVTAVSPLGRGATGAFAYAIVDHTLVVASSAGYVDTIIDTDHGKRPSLQSTADWTAVQKDLPSDRIVLFYLDVPALIKALPAGTLQSGASGVNLNQLKAYRGVGMAASAQSNGFAVDAVADFDPSALDDAGRQALGIPAHANSTATDTPSTALGYVGITGVQYLLRSLTDAAGKSSPQAAGVIASIGLTSALGHFTGDAGLEFGLGSGTTPSGALIVATDNDNATRSFLDQALPTLLASSPGLAGPGSGSSLGAAPRVTHETYKGADISEINGSGAVAPAWTVTKGVAIVGSTPAEVKAVIDAAGGGASLATSPGFTSALGDNVKNNGSLYIDVHGIVDALEKSLPAEQKVAFERDVLPNLRPIQAIVLTGKNASDHSTSRLLIEIP